MGVQNYKDLFKNISGLDAPFHFLIRWPWWFGGFSGFTLGFIIFIKNKNDIPVVCHELIHVKQFYKSPLLFWIFYLLEIARRGYRLNKYEVEAYRFQARVVTYLRGLNIG